MKVLCWLFGHRWIVRRAYYYDGANDYVECTRCNKEYDYKDRYAEVKERT